MDKELICRNIINILDVKRCREWEMFATDDLYNVLIKFLKSLVPNCDPKDIDMIMTRNEQTIKKTVENKNISIEEHNHLMEDLRVFKRKYILKKQ